MQNHFELFQLPVRFDVDMEALNAAYHEVQGRVHPDKFAHAGDAEKRVAMQWATRANEAYQVLKHPLKRATYLCELNGVDLQTESNTSMPPAFLMQQMEWREALEEAQDGGNVAALDKLDGEMRSVRKQELARIEDWLNAGDYQQAAQGVRQLMFLEKIGEELAQAFEKIGS